MYVSKRKVSAFLLLLLSPCIAELLSSSSPPLEFFQPLTFLLLISFYGTGALLVREAWVRWGRSPLTLLLLDAAYGIFEEGLIVKSFFSTTWPDLGVLAWYGRWLGVNWVWAVMLTLYHSVFSISIPIILSELLFPEIRREPWFSPRGLKVSAVVFALVSLIFFVFFRYRVPVVHLLASLFSVLFLIVYSRKLTWIKPLGFKHPPSAVKLAIIGSLWSTILIIWPYLSANLRIPALLCVALQLAAFALFFRWVLQFNWHSELKVYEIVTSPLWMLVLLAFLAEFDTTRTDNPAGMSLVALTAAILIVMGRWKLMGRVQAAERKYYQRLQLPR